MNDAERTEDDQAEPETEETTTRNVLEPSAEAAARAEVEEILSTSKLRGPELADQRRFLLRRRDLV